MEAEGMAQAVEVEALSGKPGGFKGSLQDIGNGLGTDMFSGLLPGKQSVILRGSFKIGRT